jgi:hypothetical protein
VIAFLEGGDHLFTIFSILSSYHGKTDFANANR